MPDRGTVGGLVCSRCGSRRVRRSRPHNVLERFARGVLGVHFHRCRNCGTRGSRWHQRSFWFAFQRRRRKRPPEPVSTAIRAPVRASSAFTIGALLLAVALLAALAYLTSTDTPSGGAESSSR